MNDKSKLWPRMVMVLVSACAAAGVGGIATVVTAADEPASATPPPPATAPATTRFTSPELAIRYASLAQDTLRQKVVIAPHFKEAAALLMSAMELDPNEPRYPRMLYEAMLQLHDPDAALKAIKAYRAINTQTATDQTAMVNYIDLSAQQMETAEQRFDFFKSLLDSRAPEPVKSYAALRASQVARERGQASLEDQYLGQALRLNPLNLEALRARYEALTANGTAVERVGVLLAMLKSNPIQLPATYRVAREAADAGLVEDSLAYYARCVDLAGRLGQPPGREFALGYATELLIAGQPQLIAGTKTITDQLLKQDGGDVDTLLIRWLAERAGADKEAVTKYQKQLLNAALNRVTVLRQKLGDATATTRPVESTDALTIPDIAGDLAKLKDPKFADLVVPYAQSVSDLAWYLVFVANDAAEAQKMLPALKTILSEKDPTLVRTEGWIFYAQGQFDQAGVKLKAVADQDVLAQAGNLLLWAKNPAEKEHAKAAARKLLLEHPSGLLATLLMDTLKDLNVKLVERDDAQAIRAQLADFPKAWLRIIDAPQNFYVMKAEMVDGHVLFPFGEPMFARVYIKNISKDFDITIGPEGVIHNDLWFDAQLRGLVQQTIAGAAYERLGQVLVLKPGQVISQTVRLDQGQLAQVLAGNPNASITFYGRVRTNPRGDGTAGPGGYEAAFSSITERSGFALNDNAMKGLTAALTTGKMSEKVRSMELIVAETEQLRAMKEPTDQTRNLVNVFVEAIQSRAGDADPVVSTWATFLAAVQSPAKRGAVIQQLVTDAEPTRRVLGMLIANSLPLEQQKQLTAKVLETEKNETVRLYATGMSELAKLMAERPTTAPTTGGDAATAPPTPTTTTPAPTPTASTPDNK